MTATDQFALLENRLATLQQLAEKIGPVGCFGQEALRFYSIARALKASSALANSSRAERQINHALGRTLFEGLIWVLYIFSNPAERVSRFNEKLDTFRHEYAKLWGEALLPGRAQLEPADASWKSREKKSVNGLLKQLEKEYGNNLGQLYVLYRIASFDTHGNSLPILFEEVFGKKCNFSTLDCSLGFDFIAQMYLVVLADLEGVSKV